MAFEFTARDGVDEITYFGVVTGTHSAGKSTLVASLSDPEFADRFNLDHLSISPQFPRLGGGILNVASLEIPMLVIEEASTYYARKLEDPTVLTDNYTFEDQIIMEEVAADLRGLATERMGEILPLLQPDADPLVGVEFLD